MITRGQKINDRYQIIRTIGEGGMANVYLAYDTILDRNVAVKILRGDLANDEKFVPYLIGLATVCNMHSKNEYLEYKTILKGHELLVELFNEYNK